jgi:hypothetical protein
LQEAKGNQPYLRIFEAEDFKSFLPIIYSIRKVKIAEAYHNISRVGRSRDNMALSLIGPDWRLIPGFLNLRWSESVLGY